ncbi:MAG: hypothetical protein IIZ40_00655 [Bacilli bacterium]|nr:hypothetical protein [Bacilli bacterium]
MKSKVFIRLKDKENNCESEEITIEELIFNQDDIEFRFPNYVEEYEDGSKDIYEAQLSYKDFLFFQDDYEVIARIG